MEQWRDIPGFEGRYQASDQGRIKSLPFMQRYLLRNGVEAFRRTRERILKVRPNNRGYLLVQLWLDNAGRMFTVHRLVATLFVPNPNALPEVNHRDGIKANCRADNLEWSTRSDNKQHAVANGLNTQAVRVTHPVTGQVFPSIRAAARAVRCRPSTVRA